LTTRPTTRDNLLLLAERRIAFWTDGPDLRFRARKDTFDAELKRFVSQHKSELISLLHPHGETPVTVAPLSYGQRAQWFLQQLRPESAAYNIAFGLRFLQRCDKAALQRAANGLAERHGMLNANFGLLAGEPVQCVPQTGRLRLEDLHADNDEDAIKEAERFAAQPFDLAHGPLMRIGLVQGVGNPLLVIGIHHVAVDYWSLALLVEELISLYLQETGTGADAPPPHAPDHIDFVCWQQRMLESPQGERMWAYWRERIDTDAAVTELPTDRPRPSVQGYRGKTRTVELETALAESLKTEAQSLGVTPNAILLACLSLLLTRYTGEKRPVIGCVTTGRSRRDHDRIIGYLANPVVLSLPADTARPFASLAQAAHRELLQALENQDYPFPLLVERLGAQRDPSRNPIFQILFDALSWTGADASSIGAQALKVEPVELGQQEGQFDLSVWVSEHAQGWRISFKYDADLYDEALVTQWQRHFLALLQAGLANKETPAGALAMLTSDERKNALEIASGGTALSPPVPTIHGLFEYQARRNPDKTALVWQTESLTYGELEQRANQLARRLLTKNLPPESRIAICLHRTPAMVIAMLAILKSGHAYVPLDPAYPEARLEYLLNDASAPLVITSSDLAPTLDRKSVPLILVDDHTDAPPDGMPLPVVRPEQLAYVIYTSGSTGGPKGVAIEHRNTVAYLTWALDWFSKDDLSTMLASISICFDLSIIDIFLPLAAGQRIALASSILDITSDWARQQEVTMAIAVPSAMRELLRQGLPPSLRTLGLGGEILPASLVKDIHRYSKVRRIDNIFGPTEITICCTTERIIDQPDAVPTVGRPLRGYQVYVLDEHMQPTPPLVRGEIYVGGVGVTREYLGKPELNRQRYLPDPFSDDPGARLFRTGDFGRYRRDGRLEFLGREDDQIKLRGFRIQLDEIEEALRTHPDVEHAAAVLHHSQKDDARIIAYCTPRGENVSEDDLRTYLMQKLPHYMVPARIVMLDALPTTPNGKIDRRLLRTWTVTVRGRGIDSADAIEQALLDLWRQLLDRPDVNAEDNFFEAGGHSLLLVRLREEVRSRWAVDLEVVDLFRLPNIRALAEAIRGSAPASAGHDALAHPSENSLSVAQA